jgi:predicted extracellular nuclease
VPLSAHDSVRTGQELTGLVGVLHFAFGHYRLQPTAPFTLLTQANPRSSHPPSVGGTFHVASFNVLNYFSTLKDSGKGCGPALNRACRGADNKQEQQRQLQKLVAAISAIDADIVGLLELENNTSQSLHDLVGALNKATGAGRYAFIATSTIGRDVIKAGLLYQPALATPYGRFTLLDSRVDRRFDDALNRPALAQSFRITAGDRKLTVVVTHLKSKQCPDPDAYAGAGANAGGPNRDMKDGEGCFNHTRSEAAAALAAWSLADPTGTGATQVLIVGDFNSHRMEDPVRALEKSGLVNLLARSGGAEAYTYVYDGRAGTLDYAFASPQLLPFVTGAAAWHINADEPEVLDYNIETGKPASYFAGNPFRSSDHDPVIVGLDLEK